MESPTRFRVAVASAALAGCAVGGVAFGPAVAGALQEDDPTTTTTAPDSTTDDSTTDDSTTDDSTDPEECGPGGRGGPGHLGIRPGLEAAAEAIGIEAEDLRTAVREGQTIAEVAEANGVDPATVVAAMVTEAEERLADAVADGRIDQARADELGADLEARITDLVNGEFEFPGPGDHRRPTD